MAQLPQHIKDRLLYTLETQYIYARLQKMAERYGFTENFETFTDVVAKTLYGEIPIDELETHLQQQLDLSNDVARFVAIEVDQDVFAEVRDEFNVAQGFADPSSIPADEGTPPSPSTSEESEQSIPANTQTQAGSAAADQNKEQPPEIEDGPAARPPQKPQQNTGSKRRPGKQSDPYREPIDDE